MFSLKRFAMYVFICELSTFISSKVPSFWVIQEKLILIVIFSLFSHISQTNGARDLCLVSKDSQYITLYV